MSLTISSCAFAARPSTPFFPNDGLAINRIDAIAPKHDRARLPEHGIRFFDISPSSYSM
jgi:hypothetical protein